MRELFLVLMVSLLLVSCGGDEEEEKGAENSGPSYESITPQEQFNAVNTLRQLVPQIQTQYQLNVFQQSHARIDEIGQIQNSITRPAFPNSQQYGGQIPGQHGPGRFYQPMTMYPNQQINNQNQGLIANYGSTQLEQLKSLYEQLNNSAAKLINAGVEVGPLFNIELSNAEISANIQSNYNRIKNRVNTVGKANYEARVIKAKDLVTWMANKTGINNSNASNFHFKTYYLKAGNMNTILAEMSWFNSQAQLLDPKYDSISGSNNNFIKFTKDSYNQLAGNGVAQNFVTILEASTWFEVNKNGIKAHLDVLKYRNNQNNNQNYYPQQYPNSGSIMDDYQRVRKAYEDAINNMGDVNSYAFKNELVNMRNQINRDINDVKNWQKNIIN